jgi:hypothetical protein
MTANAAAELSHWHLQPECSNSMLTGIPSQQCGSPRPAAGPKDCTKGTRPGADGPELRGTDVTGLYLPSTGKDSAGPGRLGACECVDGPNGSVTETVPCKTASYRHLMIVRLYHIPPMCPTDSVTYPTHPLSLPDHMCGSTSMLHCPQAADSRSRAVAHRLCPLRRRACARAAPAAGRARFCKRDSLRECQCVGPGILQGHRPQAGLR